MLHFFSTNTLRKKWWRSDAFWVSTFLYRDPIRWIPLYIDTCILMRSQYWTRNQIDQLARDRLSDVILRASRVPFWSERFKNAHIQPEKFMKGDLQKLPVLTKQELIPHDISYYTNSSLLSKTHVDHTSGSTAIPFQFRLDWRAELRYFAIRERMFREVAGGARPPVIYFRGRVNPGFFFRNHILFFSQGYNTIKERLMDFVELARSFKKGFVVYGYTSSMRELARRLSEANVCLPIRAIVATGENATESDRTYIEETLHTRFVMTYATWELKWIGHECEHGSCHINEEYVFVEIVDDTGVALPEGMEGRIVLTGYDSEAMPFIRYSSGDRGILSDSPCACGRTLRTLTVFGRQTDIISLPEGITVPLFDIATAFDTYARAVRQYQIIQTDVNSFRIKIIAGERFYDAQSHLRARLIQLLHPDSSIEWDLVEDIPQAPSGKALTFIRVGKI